MKRVLLCAVLMAWAGMASAVVYKWVDAQGKLQYGDRPPDGVHAEVVEMPGSHAAPASPDQASSASSQPGVPAARTATRDSAMQSENAKQAVDEDVAQTREKQCADAQDRYKKLIEGRRLYKAGPDGEREYLSSAEIDAERLGAKQAADAICNSST